jgi:uncharacterized membrane protein
MSLHAAAKVLHNKPEGRVAQANKTGRIAALDLARTAAIVGMVAFHFTFDLEMFGYVMPGTTQTPFFYYMARMVAGSFLFLAGVSLWLAHGTGIRWPAFWRRFAMVWVAAVVISVLSLYLPTGLILFGILHCIAFGSLIGLAFLRLPAVVTLVVAAIIFALPWFARSPMFDPVWLVWLGLADRRPLMADYVPLLPWLAPLLAGIAFARIATASGLWARLRARPWAVPRALIWPGQHSLAIYLVHQPLMIGAFAAIHYVTT